MKKRERRERMIAALRATDDDIYEINGRLVVCGRGAGGELVELGSVSLAAAAQKTANLRGMIERIKFGG